MPLLPMYLDPFNAERNGEAARKADRRAMYARADAPPLPDDAATERRAQHFAGVGRSLARVLRPLVGRLRRPVRQVADSA